jgi:hypothetical protein
MPLNFCFQFPVHVSLMAARCWCTMSCGEATTKVGREARAARARANFILKRDGLGWPEAAAIDAFLLRFPLPLYTCRESGMFSSRCAINIGVGASFFFPLAHPLPVDPNNQGPEAPRTYQPHHIILRLLVYRHCDGARSGRWSSSFNARGRHRHNLRQTRASY